MDSDSSSRCRTPTAEEIDEAIKQRRREMMNEKKKAQMTRVRKLKQSERQRIERRFEIQSIRHTSI